MLTMYAGGYARHTRESLFNIPVTPRVHGKLIRTEMWKGIQHGELVQGMVDSIQKTLGYHVVPETETYLVSPNQAALVGGFCFGEKGSDGIVRPLIMDGVQQETHYALGFTHANDSTRSLKVYGGGRVFYCTNGVVTCQDKWSRKHTSGLYLKDWLCKSLSNLWKRFTESTKSIQQLSDTPAEKELVDHLLLRMCRDGLLSWHHAGDLDTTWRHATQEERLDWMMPGTDKEWGFEESLWDFYNAFNHVTKKLSANQQLPALRRGFELMREHSVSLVTAS